MNKKFLHALVFGSLFGVNFVGDANGQQWPCTYALFGPIFNVCISSQICKAADNRLSWHCQALQGTNVTITSTQNIIPPLGCIQLKKLPTCAKVSGAK
jgi:hypothetical protein